MPTYVGSANNTGATVQQLDVTYTPTTGNSVVIGVLLETGNAAVSGIFDSKGADIFGNPINAWQSLGAVTLGSCRVELWGCLSVVDPPTKFTVLLSDVQNTVVLNLLEYSGVSSFGSFGSTSNTGYSNLFFNGTAASNQDIMVVMFGMQAGSGSSGSGTINIPNQANYVITPAVSRQSVSSFGGQLLALEQAVIIPPQLLVAEIVTQGVASDGFMAVGVTLNGGFTILTPPGFSDIDETKLVAGEVVHSLKLNQIAQNAALGMVRPEFFYGVYQDGNTVDAPISPVDKYQYQRDELVYVYTPYTTFDPQSGWTSAAGILFYFQWDVDPITGVVTMNEYYHPDGNSPVAKTSDGQLIVLTIAQRANDGIKMRIPPGLSDVDLTLCGDDKPVTQTLMQTLAKNSKFAAVKAEVFYCGEFVNGQTVPTPISAVDGYQYNYGECKFISSWKWNTAPSNFGPPPMATATGGDADGGWSQLNYIQAAVDALGTVSTNVHFFNHNDIDPSDPSNGGVVYGRVRVYCFCQRNKGPYFGLPQLTANAPNQTTDFSRVTKVSGLVGSTNGNLSVTFKAGSAASLVIHKAVIKRTLAGDDTVIDTTDLLFSTSVSTTVGIGAEKTCDVISAWTFDNGHDYYIVMYYRGQGRNALTLGTVNSVTPIQYLIVASDLTGNTTISSMGLSVDVANFLAISAITLTIVGDTTANQFFEIPITNFVPGQPLTANTMTQLADNVKESAYAIEFFGPTNHVNGDTVALPTSPTDGYTYSRKELLYIWQWHDSGNPKPRLFGLGASIGSSGVVNLMSWHAQVGGPIALNVSGASLDVITIGVRQSVATSQTAPLNDNNGNPPSDLSSLVFGGSGGFVINGGS